MNLFDGWNRLGNESLAGMPGNRPARRARTRGYHPGIERLEPVALLSAGLADVLGGRPSLSQRPLAVEAGHAATAATQARPNPNRVTRIVAIPPNVPGLLHAGNELTFRATPLNAQGQPVSARVRFRVVNPGPWDQVATIISSNNNVCDVLILAPRGRYVTRNSSARLIVSVGNVQRAILLTREAAPFDGTYSGSYSGTVSGFGQTQFVQGGVLFTVGGGTITVTVPAAGSGQVTRSGDGSFTTGGGSVAGATFTAHFIRWRSGAVTATGTWSVNQDGVTGGGMWSATLSM